MGNKVSLKNEIIYDFENLRGKDMIIIVYWFDERFIKQEFVYYFVVKINWRVKDL